jgi:hypothetical protein
MVEKAEQTIRKEIVNLRRIAKKSKLGDHITEDILIPILDKIDETLDPLLDWLGFLIQDEVHFLLSTAPTGWEYDVYYVDKSMPYGQQNVKVGTYQASERGGPPSSPEKGRQTEFPQSGTLYKSIYYEIKDGTVIVGIREHEPPYKIWFQWGKIFIFADESKAKSEKKTTLQYGQILDSEEYEFHRPYFTSAVAAAKPEIKKRIREEFRKALQESTKRPTVKKAIEIHIIWRSYQE